MSQHEIKAEEQLRRKRKLYRLRKDQETPQEAEERQRRNREYSRRRYAHSLYRH